MPTPNSTLGLTVALLEAHQAGDIIDAAGHWLADQQVLEDFTWIKSRRVLESKHGSRRETVTVERSYQDRALRAVSFKAAAITVTDTALRAWRRENPQLTLVRPASVEGIVCSASLLDFGAGSSVNLADPHKRGCDVVQRPRQDDAKRPQ